MTRLRILAVLLAVSLGTNLWLVQHARETSRVASGTAEAVRVRETDLSRFQASVAIETLTLVSRYSRWSYETLVSLRDGDGHEGDVTTIAGKQQRMGARVSDSLAELAELASVPESEECCAEQRRLLDEWSIRGLGLFASRNGPV